MHHWLLELLLNKLLVGYLIPTDWQKTSDDNWKESWSEKMPTTPRSYGRPCVLHYTLVLQQYSLLMNLADRFVTFFSDKIAKIRNSFSSSDSFSVPPPPDVPNFSCFTQVSKKEIRKIIMKSPSKSCLLDPWPTFLVKIFYCPLLPGLLTAHCQKVLYLMSLTRLL